MPHTRLHHHFRHPPRRRHRQPPANVFGLLVGKVDGALDDSDDNHVFIPVRVGTGRAAGLYRVALNLASTGVPTAAQHLIVDEPVGAEGIPPDGFYPDVTHTYAEHGLRGADFTVAESEAMRAAVHTSLENAEIIAAYGVTFSPYGLHDLHYNNGELPGSLHRDRPGNDGALSIYFHDETGRVFRRWIFVKFQSQILE